MPKFQQSVPASYRKPIPDTRLNDSYPNDSRQNPLLTPRPMRLQPSFSAENRSSLLVRSRFMRLPFEPEDARITGVTRSLHRRLLALNLRGLVPRVIKDQVA